MRFRQNLYTRIAIVLALIISAGSMLFVLALHELNDRLEQILLDTLVGHELEEIAGSYKAEEPIELPHSSTLQVYLQSQVQQREIPAFLINLPPNIHRDVTHVGRYYHVAITDLGKDRLYIAFDISNIKEHERNFTIVLAIAGVVAPLIVLLIVVRYINRVLKPVSAIAQELSSLDPDSRNIRVTSSYKGYEVEQIANAINQYIERLDGFVEREQFFATSASHELRTPITVIRTSSELAQEFIGDRPQANEYLQKIDRAAAGMEEMIEGLLFLARETKETPENEFVPVSIFEVVSSTLEDDRHFNSHDNIKLDFDPEKDVSIRADPVHLSIVVGNLVRNALDHTQGGEIRVSFADNILSIHDSGEGIPTEELSHIFKRGYQGSSTGNSGLGLYISKKICDRYNWSIQLSSSSTGTCAEVGF